MSSALLWGVPLVPRLKMPKPAPVAAGFGALSGTSSGKSGDIDHLIPV